jgi:hypothetical protein
MPGWLKAGLIGAAVVVLSQLIGFIPVIGICSFFVTLAGYAVAGVLAARYLPPRRESGRSAGQGALAGLVAGVIGGIFVALLTPLSINAMGGTGALIAQLPPETLDQLAQMGVDPATIFNAGTVGGMMLLCCLPTGLVLGAIIGALSGLIYAAARPE